MRNLLFIVFVIIISGIFKNNLGDCPPFCGMGSVNNKTIDETADIIDEIDNADENAQEIWEQENISRADLLL